MDDILIVSGAMKETPSIVAPLTELGIGHNLDTLISRELHKEKFMVSSFPCMTPLEPTLKIALVLW